MTESMEKLLNILIISILATGKFCGIQNSDSTPIARPFNVCELANLTPEKRNGEVRISGRITGYHEFMLYDDRCASSEYVVEFSINSENRKILMDKARHRNSTDVNGTVTVLGFFEKGTGILIDYPSRQVSSIPQKAEPMRVDKVIVNRIEEFVPD